MSLTTTATGVSFADLLRDLRRTAGLTQEELAERAGLTTHAVSALERGTRTRPYPHTVRQLAAALGADEPTRGALLAAVRGRAGAGPAAPSAGAPAPQAVGLVLPGTRLLGRDRDLELVERLLTGSGRRLVTLTGTGGVGKTRLAAAVAERVAPAFPDGVTCVGLAALTSAQEVLPHVARALGVVAGPGDGPERELVALLQERHALLVLDNLEHLLDAAPQVARLVGDCPSLAVLVTSRAPLRVRGETEHAVQPLALPEGDDEGAVGRSAAGALFLDRARAVSPSFARGPGEAAAVAALCRRLAGIPLALELAATRARVLDARSLLARLDAAVDTAAARDLPQRQQTMRATIGWSYELLAADEQRLFRRLAVFAGGFDLAAAEAVADDHPQAVLIALEVLVEHHLVSVHPGGRFGLLEPIAQHAASLLVGAERQDAQRAHARHFLRVAERTHDTLAREDQLAGLAAAAPDEDNLLLAVDSSLSAGDTATAARLCWELQQYWWFRQRNEVGRRLCERVLAAGPRLAPADLALASMAAGATALALDDPVRAGQHWELACSLSEEVEDIDVRAHAGAGLGLIALISGDLAGAAAQFEQARRRAGTGRRSCCGWLMSMCLIWGATVLAASGQPAAARASAEQGLAEARQRGDRQSAYMALYSLSHGALAEGDLALAERHLQEGARLAAETGDLTNLAHFLQSLVVVEVQADRARSAAVLSGAADALLERAGSPGVSYRLLDPAALQAACDRARQVLGADAYDDAVDAGRGLDPARVVQDLLGR